MVLLPALAPLVLALWCLAVALAATLIVLALVNAMGGVPVIGRVIGDVLRPVAHALSWAAGQLEGGIDSLIGWSWHLMAKMTDWFWHQFVQHSIALLRIAEEVGKLAYQGSGLQHYVRTALNTIHGIEHGVKTLEKEWHGIEHRVKVLENEVSHGIGSDVLPRLRSLDREIGRLDHQVIPAIESGVATAENDVTQLRNWITRNVPLAGTATFAGVVAFALANLGLGWLRCNSNPFNNNRNACGLWSILGRVLGLAAFLTVAFDFQEFVDASNEVASFIGTAVGDFEGSFPLSLPPLPPPQ